MPVLPVMRRRSTVSSAMAASRPNDSVSTKWRPLHRPTSNGRGRAPASCRTASSTERVDMPRSVRVVARTHRHHAERRAGAFGQQQKPVRRLVDDAVATERHHHVVSLRLCGHPLGMTRPSVSTTSSRSSPATSRRSAAARAAAWAPFPFWAAGFATSSVFFSKGGMGRSFRRRPNTRVRARLRASGLFPVWAFPSIIRKSGQARRCRLRNAGRRSYMPARPTRKRPPEPKPVRRPYRTIVGEPAHQD